MWKADEISKALSLPEIQSNICFSGISIDSRLVKKNSLFLALKGNNFDSHNFIKNAINAGASGLIIEQITSEIPNNFPFFIVNNTIEALKNLSVYARKRFKGNVVGITGSAGKTTTKEMLKKILENFASTDCTFGNYNNHIGVPFSLAHLHKDSKYGIFEIGTNHEGEILPLTEIVKPDVAVITTIGDAHIGNFGSVEKIAQEKSQILSALDKKGFFVTNFDNQFFNFLKKRSISEGISKILAVGKNKGCDVRLINYSFRDNFSLIKADFFGQTIEYKLNCQGEHNAINSLIAITVAKNLGNNLDGILEAIERFLPVDGRGKTIIKKIDNLFEVSFINDAYNANPSSMKASLKTFCEIPNEKGRKVAILGDMAELGEHSNAMHKDLGIFVKNLKDLNVLITVGKQSLIINQEVKKYINSYHFENVENLKNELVNLLKEGDRVLLKASNFLKLSSII